MQRALKWALDRRRATRELEPSRCVAVGAGVRKQHAAATSCDAAETRRATLALLKEDASVRAQQSIELASR